MTRFVKKALLKDFPIVQLFEVNNSSQRLVDGAIEIGNADVPEFLHFHVVPRDNPNVYYNDGIFLQGPKVGENFDLVPKTTCCRCDDGKFPWGNDEDMSAMADIFRDLLVDVLADFPSISLRIS